MDVESLWQWLSERMSEQSSQEPNRPQHPPGNQQQASHYQKGSFVDTRCDDADILSYRQMQVALEQLQRDYPADVEMFSAGKSEGYGSPVNALDVWGIHILATKKPERTAFFVAGHHPSEHSGPVSVYEIAKRLLQSHAAANPNVEKLREDTHLVFIPQVDVDYYHNLNLSHRADYFTRGYSRLISEQDTFQVDNLKDHDMNFYDAEEHLEAVGYPLFGQTRAVLHTIDDTTVSYAPAFLAMDYHEGSATGKYELTQETTRRTDLLYVLAEVSRTYPVPTPAEIEHLSQIDDETFNLHRILTFSRLMYLLDANSFVMEACRPESSYSLTQRVEMNLIATDRILARYYLGC